MKPLLKLRPQFVIPEPFRAYCHGCKQGFLTLEDLAAHDREHIIQHQRDSAKRNEAAPGS
jgi:hypothetical protein